MSHTPGSRLVINAPTLLPSGAAARPAPPANNGNSSGGGLPPANVWLIYLRSYDNMGQARVQCVSGCRCTDAVLDAHRASQKVSVPVLHMLQVSQAASCQLAVEVLGSSSSEGHKFKVVGVLVDGGGMGGQKLGMSLVTRDREVG